MYRKCTTEKAANQQRIFQNTLREALKTQDYDQISVTMLCARTGLSRKTFYRLFDCKDDVVNALLDDLIHQMYRRQNMETAMEQELLRVFAYWKEQRDILDFLEKNRQSTLLLERAFLYISREDHLAFQAMDAVDHPQRQEIMLFMLSGVMGLIIHWHHSGFARPAEEMARICSDILVKPPIRREILGEMV